ncbi:hypothetical protein TSOC_014283 [Tetrabaena socialis]|uniref:Uncharacterized protein n=1 Tax=Tetrabaena socialis TaxID=47790 RepID=A0A2J7ZHY6_9CHLO|nr:hypothetical protein TSOC_014284 [Tetrabaena socialis]PNG99884.1 hypothetical protein TSOC_014283 [Tetrabaena socialis]|eukprot:PNG99882.1 hypothetical protein TSOC_014284 [Tetrabaena socialis]
MVVHACSAAEPPDYSAGTGLPNWLGPHNRKCYRGPADKAQHTAHIHEVGYCGELDHGRTQQRRAAQPKGLAAALAAARWKVQYGMQGACAKAYTSCSPLSWLRPAAQSYTTAQ